MLGRFAPSTTGEAHPGTLLSALLVWLDVRSRGGRVLLRLEDLDRERVRAEWSRELEVALAELGLEWDERVVQSASTGAHEAALDRLAAMGRLYPCTCSRSTTRASGRRAPDGGWAYDNACRSRPLPAEGWRAVDGPLRARLDDDRVELVDASGLELSQQPARDMGDPVVRRRDGAIAYQLAVVIDDAAAGVTDVVRGRDIAPSTATQVLLQRLLGLPTPAYRHHLLLLEGSGDKLAKLHGSLPYSQLRARYRGDELVGILAAAAGIVDEPRPCTPRELVAGFDWGRVAREDKLARWDDARGLVIQ